jgi:hypothetical protein
LYLISLALIVLSISNSFAATKCLGPEKSEMQIIYLHGFNVNAADAKIEAENEKILQKMATVLKARIALPKSPIKCKNGIDYCWKPVKNKPQNSQANFKTARDLSASCFGANKKAHLLGYSNGGYLAAQIMRYCLVEDFLSVVAVSASAEATGIKDYSGCKELHLVNSTKDPVYKGAYIFLENVKKLKGKISLHAYNSTEAFPLEPTLTLLKTLKAAQQK